LGFSNQRDATLWRRTNVKFDVLKFDVIPRARCQKWLVPLGSFGLDPSCLFPFLPRLGHSRDGDSFRPERGFGQIRLSIDRGIRQPSVKVPNVWWAGDSADVTEAVTGDVLNRITEKALPFFSRFDDTQEVLRTFLEDENAIGREGVWGFGNLESSTRLLYTGFAAIECRKWNLASSSLRACKARTMAIPEPVGEDVRAEILPYIDQGFTCIERLSAWLNGFAMGVREIRSE
jgi:hypothetical protein